MSLPWWGGIFFYFLCCQESELEMGNTGSMWFHQNSLPHPRQTSLTNNLGRLTNLRSTSSSFKIQFSKQSSSSFKNCHVRWNPFFYVLQISGACTNSCPLYTLYVDTDPNWSSGIAAALGLASLKLTFFPRAPPTTTISKLAPPPSQ